MHVYSFSTFPGAPLGAFQQPVDNNSSLNKTVQWLRALAYITRLLSGLELASLEGTVVFAFNFCVIAGHYPVWQFSNF